MEKDMVFSEETSIPIPAMQELRHSEVIGETG